VGHVHTECSHKRAVSCIPALFRARTISNTGPQTGLFCLSFLTPAGSVLRGGKPRLTAGRAIARKRGFREVFQKTIEARTLFIVAEVTGAACWLITGYWQ